MVASQNPPFQSNFINDFILIITIAMHLITTEDIEQFPNIANAKYCALVNAKTALNKKY